MSVIELNNWKVHRDERGVVTATLDVVDRAVNVFDEEVMRELHELLQWLTRNSDVKLVVFCSGKETGFLAGADVNLIASIESPEEIEEKSRLGQELFGKVENLPMPTIAAIRGVCLGGGLEFALACRYRFACDDSSTRLGLPEIELGILPAWGGTQRLPQRVGLADALPVILQGKKLSASDAHRLGAVDRIAPPESFERDLDKMVEELLAGKRFAKKAKTFVGWLRDDTRLGRNFVLRMAGKQIKRHVKNYPAVGEALEAVKRGLTRSTAAGLEYEQKAIGRLLFSETCRSLMGLFFQREAARSGRRWGTDSVSEAEKRPNRRIAIVGAGAMGAGIAQLAAHRGFEVVVKEVNQEFLNKAMDRIRKQFDTLVRKRKLRGDEAAEKLDALVPTIEWHDLKTADLVIEAVPENIKLKQEVFARLDEVLPDEAVIVSNTSALSIDKLAGFTKRPHHVAGLHFFNPVHRMQLVEVVRGEKTNDEIILQLVRVVRDLGKTPLVTADSPGFLVNRVLFPYLDEAVRLACEGVPTAEIDRAMKKFGMPMGPLELLDQVGIDVAADVAQSLAAEGPTAERLAAMSDRGWKGKKAERGFYEWKKGRRRKPTEWEGGPQQAALAEFDGAIDEKLSTLQYRMVFALLNEATKCVEEHIVAEPWMVDLGMVLGTGFAPFRGGPLKVINGWGVEAVCKTLNDLEKTFGERFAPCHLLEQMAEEGTAFDLEASAKQPHPEQAASH